MATIAVYNKQLIAN